jgi:hypothetical protein
MDRLGVYWLRLSDPTPGERTSAGIWAQCWRCGVRELVTLPADLGDALEGMRQALEAHCQCAPSLLGARWELIVTLRHRVLDASPTVTLLPLALIEDRSPEQLAQDGDAQIEREVDEIVAVMMGDETKAWR